MILELEQNTVEQIIYIIRNMPSQPSFLKELEDQLETHSASQNVAVETIPVVSSPDMEPIVAPVDVAVTQ